jgi:hypothetical protein
MVETPIAIPIAARIPEMNPNTATSYSALKETEPTGILVIVFTSIIVSPSVV